MTNGNTPLDAKQARSVRVTWFNGTSGTVNSPCPDPNGAVNDIAGIRHSRRRGCASQPADHG